MYKFMLELEGARVVNPGSVGLPNDGQATAAYAVLENGAVSLERTDCDVESTVQRLRERGLKPEVVAPLEQWLRTGRMPPALLGTAPNGDTAGSGRSSA